MGIEDEAALWFAQLQDEEADDDVRAGCAAWLEADERHRVAWMNLQRLWSGVGPLSDGRLGNDTASRVAVPLPRAEGRAPPALSASRLGSSFMAVAMSAAVLLAGFLWLAVPTSAWPPWADYRTSVGERRDVVLADGSRVSLDGSTALTLKYSDAERVIGLERGRAYFQVAPNRNRPFIVRVGHEEVRAIGTAFDVNLSGNNVVVAVSEGHVKVRHGSAGQPEHDLLAGQQLRIGEEALTFDRVAPQDVDAWRAGRLVFQNAPLDEVLGSIQRYRDGRMYVSDRALGSRRFTGVFNASAPDAALETIVGLLDAHQLRIPGAVTLILPADNTP